MSIINLNVKIGMQIIGIWPNGYSGMIGFFFIIGVLTANVPFMLWQAATVYRNFEALMATFGVILAVSSGILKLMTFRLKKKDIQYVVNEIFYDWKSEHEILDTKVIKKNLSRGSYLTNWLVVIYNGVVITHAIGPLLSYTSGIVKKRLYALPARFPPHWKESPNYEMVCLWQLFSTFLNISMNGMIEGMLAILVLHAGTKAHIIRRELFKVSEIFLINDDKELASKTLKLIIEKHNGFIRFIKKIREIYLFVSFFHVFIFTLLHVVVAYMLLDALDKGEAFSAEMFLYGFFTTRALLSTSIYCIAGEYLINQSKKIFEDIYNCLWYNFNIPDKKALNFILMKAYKPIYLTPGNFGELSLNYLSGVIRTSYSILSLARATG